MAFPINLKFPVLLPSPMPSKPTFTSITAQMKPGKTQTQLRLFPQIITTRGRKTEFLTIRAVEETQENAESEALGRLQAASPGKDSAQEESPVEESSAQLGDEIKEAIKQRKEEREGDLWSGVAEEIREIEWPAFGRVLGTTGVVLGVIAGSSVVLLTVNAGLAELSDKVFAGRGVQDFFG